MRTVRALLELAEAMILEPKALSEDAGQKGHPRGAERKQPPITVLMRHARKRG